MSEPVVIDYKDQAPGHATRDNPLLQRANADGPAAANIPGVVAGLDYLYRTYGSRKMAWSDLLASAIRHAEDGYPLDATLPTTIAEGRRGGNRGGFGAARGAGWCGATPFARCGGAGRAVKGEGKREKGEGRRGTFSLFPSPF